MKHLFYECQGANVEGVIIHPQCDMERLGITYGQCVPQSMFDGWEFFDCKNIPDKLPSYIRVHKANQDQPFQTP